MGKVQICEVDRIDILTLQDNYIDLVARDSSATLQRAIPLKGTEFRNSLFAEHGFSAVVTTTTGDQSRNLLFDFGFSEMGAVTNAESLNVDFSTIEAMALSHGHVDHIGGLEQFTKRIGKPGLPFVMHPDAFRTPRYIKITEDFKILLASMTQDRIDQADVNLITSTDPYGLLGDSLMFLGEVPQKSSFEKGTPNMFYEKDGKELWDNLTDDTALVANVKDKGLVILSGCAHSGIVNTINHAQEVTGEERIHVVMGGFHLSGADFNEVVSPTAQALKALNPDFIIPTHCTGRDAVMHIEKEMPDAFLLNMVGTRLIFNAS